MYSGTVENCNFVNNTATDGDGGAIWICFGTVTNCNFVNNKATTDDSYGGAVCMYSGSVENCNFTNNNAVDCGGAVFFWDISNLTNCNFVNNIASNGSAVYFYYDGEVANCNFVNNFASNYGGAVYFNGTGEVANCNFVNSSASNRGGAVYFNSTGGVSYCNFNNNQVNEEDNSYGGAVFMSSGSVENCNFTNNKAPVYGGAIYFSISGSTHTVTNCIFTNNSAMYGGGAILFTLNDYLANCIFINNSARAGGAVYFINNSEVTNCNFVNNFASVQGGALYFGSSSTVEKCNFTNNTADWGGAIRFIDMGNVTDCNFVNNTASTYDGGAMHFSGSGTVEKSNFINNIANTGGAIVFQDSDGNVTDCNFTNNYAVSAVGAILFNGIGNVTDCNFVNNTASIYDGGAVYFDSTGSVENCNFTNNSARYGGAVYFELGPNGTVKNCNFINNAALKVGGAVYYNSTGSVENCNFINNTASRDGGAILFEANANVTGCNFTGNSAKSRGGAVYFNRYANVENSKFSGNYASNGGAIGSSTMCYGDVDGCVFTNNSAFNSGAVYMYTGIIENCNFVNNLASNTGGAAGFSEGGCFAYCNFANNIALNSGGAISIFSGIIENCNFTGNNATEGSAIYLNGFSDTNISNSRFLNNRANASADVPLNVTVNGNTIEITFMGQDNLLNAIYSNGDVNFTNVTYWGANGIANTGDNPIVLSPSMCEAGQNISVTGIVNGNILTTTKVTDGNGKIVLENISDYYLVLRHDGDSYYTEAEKTISNMKFNVNVVSQTTSNRTVNLTAESNILSEVMPGNLVFILPNGTQINATYGGNGTWWAMHTFDECAVYKVNASYVGLENVVVRNGTVTVFKALSKFSDVVVMSNNVTLTLCDENGNPISGANITYAIDGVSNATVSDDNGSFVIVAASGAEIFVDYAGSEDYVGSNITIKLATPQRQSTVIVGEDFTQYACDYYEGERGNNFTVQLTDADGNPLANKTVFIGYNGVTLNRTTDANGFANVQINLKNAGLYTFVVVFLDDDDYNATMKVFKVTIEKKPTSISASAKTFKASAKTKKYTVTLKTIKGASIDGKTYLASGKKVTLKINGKTYTAKTNAKGQATFSLKITKKGKFTAVIKYDGDNTYKASSKKVKITIK